MIFEKISLEEDEQIIAVIRRHWFFLVKQCFFILILILMPLIGLLAIHILAPGSLATATESFLPYLIFFYALWLLLNWMFLAFIWTDHYLDIWAITNRRVININQVALFKRQIGSFRLERLQDLNVEINGIIATLLDYGTIHAETASGSADEFKAVYLPNPRLIKAIILQAADKRIDVKGV